MLLNWDYSLCSSLIYIITILAIISYRLFLIKCLSFWIKLYAKSINAYLWIKAHLVLQNTVSFCSFICYTSYLALYQDRSGLTSIWPANKTCPIKVYIYSSTWYALVSRYRFEHKTTEKKLSKIATNFMLCAFLSMFQMYCFCEFLISKVVTKLLQSCNLIGLFWYVRVAVFILYLFQN